MRHIATLDPISVGVQVAVDSIHGTLISRPFIGVGGPCKRNPVIPDFAKMKSGKRTTPFVT